MTEPVIVVMPTQADGSPPQERVDEVVAAIEKSLHKKLHAGEPHEPNQKGGFLKKVVANPDSLYKYISWEDPVRTLGSYMGLLGLLFGLHYLHLTRMFLKLSATGLGAVSFASLISRSTKSDIVARIRPEYKQVPESTLNATLSDIHDLIQWLALQAQKIIYGEDLGKTMGAFFGMTAVFWLTKVMSPFGLAILGLTLLYIAPLVSSPRSREVVEDAKIRTQELVHVTAENTKVMAQDSKAKAADLLSVTQETAGNLSTKTNQTADSLTSGAQQTAGSLAAKNKQTANNLSHMLQHTAENLSSTTQPIVEGQPTEIQAPDGNLLTKTQYITDNQSPEA